MNEHAFRAVVARFEPMARAHPRRYKAVVALLALPGLLAPAPLPLALMGGAGLLLRFAFQHPRSGEALFFCFVGCALLVLLAVGAACSFWSRLPAPDHPRVHPEEAPRLFAMLDDLRRAFPGLRIHHERTE